jgi:hypothetical protein
MVPVRAPQVNANLEIARSGRRLGRALFIQATMSSMMTVSDVETILRLRLIVCRAAQLDSLQWWDDQSLTTEGAFVVERLFGGRPRVAAAKIALAAARVRHWAAMPKSKNVVHLFDFGDDIEEQINSVSLEEGWISSSAFTSTDDFGSAIRGIAADEIDYKRSDPDQNGALELHLSARLGKGMNVILARARVLALTYAVARPRQPVFPFLKENNP